MEGGREGVREGGGEVSYLAGVDSQDLKGGEVDEVLLCGGGREGGREGGMEY